MKKKIAIILVTLLIVLCVCSIKTLNEKPIRINNVSNSKNVTTTLPETTTQQQNFSVTISFLGDCMMASFKGQYLNKNMNWCLDNYDYTYFFEKAMPYIGQDDITIANCENVFTDTATSERNKNSTPSYWYRSASKNANVFSKNSIDAVSIANNHIRDYGEEGKQNTIDALDNANVLWGNDDKTVIIKKNDIKFGFLMVSFWGDWHLQNILNSLQDITNKTDIQIVYFHGGTERIHYPENWKINGCKKLIDAGADLIIGGHPHVLQPLEKYKDTNIVYSLGNFCYGGSKSPENRTIIYQHTFTFDGNNNLIFSKENIIPFYVYTGSTNNWQPAPITNETEKSNVLDFMYQKRNSPF